MEDVAADLMPVATAQELVNCETLRASALSTLRWDAPDPKVADLFRLEALVRFIRARSANDQTMRLLASTRMLCDAVRWRMAFDVANVVAQHAKDTSPEAERLRRCWPMGIAGKDARGVPVYHAAADGRPEGDGARRWCDRFIAQVLTDQSRIERGLDAASAAAGKHLVQVVRRRLQWHAVAARRRAIPLFKRLTRILDDNYPERLHVAYAVRCPWIFTALWTVVLPFLATDTRQRYVSSGGGDHFEACRSTSSTARYPSSSAAGCVWPSRTVRPRPARRRRSRCMRRPSRGRRSYKKWRIWSCLTDSAHNRRVRASWSPDEGAQVMCV